MAYICYNCGKKTIKGSQHRHKPGVAGRQHRRRVTHTPKNFTPNLHYARLIVNNHSKRVLLCSKCRRLLKKEGRIKIWKKEEVKKAVEPVKLLPQTKEAKKEIKEVKGEKAKEKVNVEDLVGKKK